jgi:glucokinase
VDAACLGVAGPVLDENVKVTNLPWRLAVAGLRERLGGAVSLINDFDATARGIDELAPEDLVVLQAGAAVPEAPRLIIGAGTGLGIAFSIKVGGIYQSIPTEAGRNAFAPATLEQLELWRYLYAHHARSTFELLLSGKGLMRIYDFICLQRGASASDEQGVAAAPDPAAEIVRRGIDHSDELCSAAIDLFLEIYGARAGDLALTILARGGVYIAGGIAPKLLPRMQSGVFLEAFRNKGIHSKLVLSVPVFVVTSERVAVLGTLAAAEALIDTGVRRTTPAPARPV